MFTEIVVIKVFAVFLILSTTIGAWLMGYDTYRWQGVFDLLQVTIGATFGAVFGMLFALAVSTVLCGLWLALNTLFS